jgi:glycogen debranching enzyme
MENIELRKQIYQTLHELSTDEGINASGKEDVYSCIFGRDSAKSILKIIKATQNIKTNDLFNGHEHILETDSLLAICRRGLLTLASLQGKETNIESGEEPGKGIHEYRPTNYERLLTLDTKPWYIYPDGKLRNYDSIDSTPLLLIAFYKYWEATRDNEFLLSILPNVEAGLNWIITYGDRDKDQLLEYELPKERKHGGLVVQSWTDSVESMLDHTGKFPLYPIAPVEVQGYAWLALKFWADFYSDESLNVAHTESYALKLTKQARAMKERFNDMFIIQDEGHYYAAQALDGAKNQIKTITGNPLLLLWATYSQNGRKESILEDEYVEHFVNRGFMPDMFAPNAGIRTMSKNSLTYIANENNYHNGSFWPILNGMIHEGVSNWDFAHHAEQLREATLKPIHHFGHPIELYIDHEVEQYQLYKNPAGQVACMNQAWSAAAALDLLTL